VRRVDRRRGIARRSRSVPPSCASRLPLSMAISALRPARTSAVFSVIRVSLPASANRASSMLRVVFICINMAYTYIQSKLRLPRLHRAFIGYNNTIVTASVRTAGVLPVYTALSSDIPSAFICVS
jgi:hypothetical protein